MIKPSNIYSLSKVFAENLINYYVKNKELECIVLRVFNLFGINQNKKFLIPMIIDQVINSKKIVINDISPSRDFLYIDDFITSPNARGKGYGSAMLNWAIEKARDKKCEQIHLDTGTKRHDAHKLYLNKGFKLSSFHMAAKI